MTRLSMHAARRRLAPAAGRRLRALAGLGAAALGLHLLLLGRMNTPPPGAAAWPGGPGSPVAVTTIAVASVPLQTTAALDPAASGSPDADVGPAREARVAQPGAMPEATAGVGALPAEAVDAPTPAPVIRRDRPAGARAGSAPPPVLRPRRATAEAADAGSGGGPRAADTIGPDGTATGPSGSDAVRAAPDRDAHSATDADADPQPAPERPPVTVPLYRTLLPPSLRLSYQLRRGERAGAAELEWRHDGAQYQLRFDANAAGARLWDQTSDGLLDVTGLAPGRFTDQRAVSGRVAANFRSDVGRITFSRPLPPVVWRPGVQDRLSWLIQLAAVVAAEPTATAADGRVVLQVIGARGDAAWWEFRHAGLDTTGATPLHRFTRAPHGPYDTEVEVWLDPQRHHLPVRATLRQQGGDALELTLQALVPTP